MSWASRKRALYIGSIFFVVCGVVALGLIAFLYETPSCTDGTQNGDEEGIDCGGLCDAICPFQTVMPVVEWRRFTEVAPGIYNAVALIRNPNANTFARRVPYSFKLRDSENLLVEEITGEVDIPPQEEVFVFIDRIDIPERVPVRSYFEFTEMPTWERVKGELPTLRVRDSVLSKEESLPRLTAELRNESLIPAQDIEVVAVVLGGDGNVIAASRTVVDFLSPQGTQSLIFTWPQAFTASSTEVRIIPSILP